MPPEEKKKVLNECKDQEKATDEDVQNVMNHKIPQGPNSKCLLACMHEQMGIVSLFLLFYGRLVDFS